MVLRNRICATLTIISLDLLRRVFYRWLNVARYSRRRRLVLQEKENQVRLHTLEAAWDKWREKILRPQEDEILLQCQRNILCRIFSKWHGKTKVSLQFVVPELKSKYLHRPPQLSGLILCDSRPLSSDSGKMLFPGQNRLQ